jgi:hypothetical protein
VVVGRRAEVGVKGIDNRVAYAGDSKLESHDVDAETREGILSVSCQRF